MGVTDQPLSAGQQLDLRTLEIDLRNIGRSVIKLSSRGRAGDVATLRGSLGQFYCRASVVEVVEPTSGDIESVSIETGDDALYSALHDRLLSLEEARQAAVRQPNRHSLSDRSSETTSLAIELQRIFALTEYFAELRKRRVEDRDRLWAIQFHFWGGFGFDVIRAVGRLHSLANPIESVW